MCGIAGVFAHDQSRIDVDELLEMRESMRARGPDGNGLWLSENGQMGMAHRRLAIVDISNAGAQPMARNCHVIVFNGEIYNYRILRKELEAKGHVFRSQSDTEVLLVLYLEYGPEMLRRLRGMYAFAIWNTKSGRLFLARDPFGIKPLYWSNERGTFRFASQVKTMLKAAVDTSLEAAGHVGFFLWGSVPEPWTLYRGIKALPAGHYLYVDKTGPASTVAFTNISDQIADAANRGGQINRREALDRLHAAIHDSVEAHLEADVPVGVFLSAGLDSTMLASAVADRGSPPLSVTLGFEEYAGTLDDEVPLAESVAHGLGADHVTRWVQRKDFEEQRELLVAAMDQPSIDGVNSWFVARAAASRGLKVVLSGIGGDELLGSYPSFRDVPRIVNMMRHIARVPRLGKGFRYLSVPLASYFTSPKYAGLIEYGGDLGGAYLLRRGLYMPWELPSVLDPDIVREGWQKLETLARLDRTIGAIPNPRLAVSALEMSWYMRNQLLRDADWAGMAHSLEIRVPFIDMPLLEIASEIFPGHSELGKPVVAAAVAPNLPEALFNKPKTGFSVPVRDWMSGGVSNGERGIRGWLRYIHGQFL